MKNLCVSSAFPRVEGAFGVASRGTTKMKHGAPRDELRNGLVLSGPYSRDGTEYVNVIGAIGEPFARELR